MVTRFLRDNEGQLDELGSVPGQVGPDSAGQSGGTQGLSQDLDAADESVEELADTDQAYEAGIVKAVEDADDHPERPVRAYGDHGRHSRSIPANAMPPQTSSKTSGESGVTPHRASGAVFGQMGPRCSESGKISSEFAV